MGVVSFISDKLTNLMSGLGTDIDRSTASFYSFVPLTQQQAEASYRTSWLTRKIVDVPAKDMTREWRDWQAEGSDIEKIEAEEKRLQLRAKCQRALVLARLYGGGALVLGTNDTNPEQELRPDRVKTGGLTYIHVMSRHQLQPGIERLDPADPWYGHPDLFTITNGTGQTVRLHPSRVIAFVGQKAPEGSVLGVEDWFWGDPIMQSIGEAVRNADLAQAGFAALIDEAKLDILKIPRLMEMASSDEYEQRFLARLRAVKIGKSTLRAIAIDAEEEWEQRQTTWAGMPEMLFAMLQVASGAADIPVTRLLGQSPKGLQSTGDGEERDYHSMVKAWQDDLLAPALDRVDEPLIRSALGSRPEDVYYEFAPLYHLSEKDAAEVENKRASTVKTYSDTGLFPTDALAKAAANAMIESGQWPGLDAAIEESDKELGEEPEQDPADLMTREEAVQKMQKRGAVSAEQADALITDAAPRTLYVSRKLLNADQFIRWAKGQGFDTTTPADDLHVTVCFSRTAVDWMKMGSDWGSEDGKLTVPPGGARLVEPLGDKGAVVLLFNSSQLSWRHEELERNGASHDFPEYQPHVTITYEKPADLDLSKVEPFRGKLVFGPEIFAEVVEDWEKSLTEA